MSHGLRLAPQPNCSWSPLENKSWLSSRRQSGKFSSSDLAKNFTLKKRPRKFEWNSFYEPNTICNGYICQVIQFESFFYSLLRGHQQPLKGSRFTIPKKGHQQNCQVHETLLWLTQNIFFKRLRSGLLPYLRIRILKPTKALVIGSMVRTHWMLAKVFFWRDKNTVETRFTFPCTLKVLCCCMKKLHNKKKKHSPQKNYVCSWCFSSHTFVRCLGVQMTSSSGSVALDV